MMATTAFRFALALVAAAALGACNGDSPRPDTPGAAAKSAPDRAEPRPADADDAAAVIFASEGGPVRVIVEVVRTPRAVQRGMMYRTHLPPDHGMLFIFPDERVRTFWMKNTLIPLDMIFVRGDRSVAGVVENATPKTLDTRTVGVPSRFVVEVNAGWTAAHGVGPGTRVTIENVADLPAP